MGGYVTEYSLVFIFDSTKKHVLLIKKNKGPYIGAINGVGGKIDPEDSTPCYGALREVYEETGYADSDFKMFMPLMTETYPSGCTLNIFYGVLSTEKNFEQKESEQLFWNSIDDIPPVESGEWAGEGGPAYYIQAALVDIGVR